MYTCINIILILIVIQTPKDRCKNRADYPTQITNVNNETWPGYKQGWFLIKKRSFIRGPTSSYL